MSFAPATQNRELWNAYDDPSVPQGQLLALVWRAGDRGGWLTDGLAAPIVFRCLETSREHTEPVEVVRAVISEPCFLTAHSSSHPHSLGAELALTAAIRALSRAREDRGLANLSPTTRFSAELLGAATGYLLWRGPETNLVGLLGLVSRARTLREARWLGEDVAAMARREVIERPPPLLSDAEAFASYVRATTAVLKGGPQDDVVEGQVGKERSSF